MSLFTQEKFAGDKKVGTSLLGYWEKKFIEKYTPKIPKFIETYHLTLSSIFWSIMIIIFGYLAQYNIQWLWGISVMIVCQYLTDCFDGSVGRLRNTGLIRWGYYMDHYLDYFFLCSVLIGYSFIFNDDRYNSLFFILAIFGAYMVNSYLSFSSTNQFKISYLKIGPTEIRLLFIIINTLLIFFNINYLASVLPFVFIFSLLGLIVVTYQTQKDIWKMDMEEKKKNEPV